MLNVFKLIGVSALKGNTIKKILASARQNISGNVLILYNNFSFWKECQKLQIK